MSGLSMRRLCPATLAVAAVLCTPATADAAPVTPGATPLSFNGPIPTFGCPSEQSLDGTITERLVARELRRSRPDADRIFGALALPTPVAFVCDPDAAARHEWLGGINGNSAVALTDVAWFGQRGLATASAGRHALALHVGDTLTLPPLGARGRLTVVVATSTGASTATFDAGTNPPVAVAVVGAPTTPTIRLTRADGIVEDRAVDVEAPAPVSVRARLRSGALRISLRGRAGSIAFAQGVPTRKVMPSNPVFASVAGAGRATLAVSHTRKLSAVNVAIVSLRDHTATWMRCAVNARASGPVRCGTPRRRTGQAARRFGPEQAAGRANRSTPAARAAKARTAAALTTAAASTITVRRTTYHDTVELLPGDLNGDGRPDAVNRNFGKGTSEFLVSTAPGTWGRVNVKFPPSTYFEPLPDLTADGKAELTSAGGALVTDAFGPGGALPASIDLTSRRPNGASDLVLPSPSGSLSVLWGSSVTGAIADETGDGRPELVFNENDPVVYASEAFPPGRQGRLASLLPVEEVTEATFAGSAFEITLSDDAAELEDAKTTLSAKVIASRLWTVEPVDRGAPAAAARPIRLRQIGASGQVLSERQFTAAGVPQLLDVDSVTGDALVRMRAPQPCPAADPSIIGPAVAAPCPTDRIVRVTPDGSTLVSIEAPSGVSAGFLPRGTQGSGIRDVALWFESGVSIRPPMRATAPGEGGTIALARSELRGDAELASLPVLADQGVPLQAVGNARLVILPDGSRWLGADTARTRDDQGDLPGRFVLIQPN